jgi:hypothetical protein
VWAYALLLTAVRPKTPLIPISKALIFGKYRDYFVAMEKKMKKRIAAFLYGLTYCLFIWLNFR